MIDLPYLFGGEEVFKKAYVDGLNEESKNALDNLKRIYELLCLYGFESTFLLTLVCLKVSTTTQAQSLSATHTVSDFLFVPEDVMTTLWDNLVTIKVLSVLQSV